MTKLITTMSFSQSCRSPSPNSFCLSSTLQSSFLFSFPSFPPLFPSTNSNSVCRSLTFILSLLLPLLPPSLLLSLPLSPSNPPSIVFYPNRPTSFFSLPAIGLVFVRVFRMSKRDSQNILATQTKHLNYDYSTAKWSPTSWRVIRSLQWYFLIPGLRYNSLAYHVPRN